MLELYNTSVSTRSQKVRLADLGLTGRVIATWP